MSVGWVYDPYFLRHDTGATHPERPERLEAVVRALDGSGLLARMRPLRFDAVSTEVLGWVHEPAYVELVRLACEEGMTFLGDRETRTGRDTFEVARAAAGGVLAACEAVMSGEVRRAFCAVRPPGHHAERDCAGGYCLFNNVALGAEYLIRRHGIRRVAIVDWDVHHGNGTQRIFEDRADVLFISLHEHPDFQYPGSGRSGERGIGAGEGFTLNLPMRPGSGDADYRAAFAGSVMPALDRFAPEFVLISAGFDAAADDHAAGINLEPFTFTWMTRDLLAVAARHAEGRLVSMLEGGYDLPSLERCVVQHVRALVEWD